MPMTVKDWQEGLRAAEKAERAAAFNPNRVDGFNITARMAGGGEGRVGSPSIRVEPGDPVWQTLVDLFATKNAQEKTAAEALLDSKISSIGTKVGG